MRESTKSRRRELWLLALSDLIEAFGGLVISGSGASTVKPHHPGTNVLDPQDSAGGPGVGAKGCSNLILIGSLDSEQSDLVLMLTLD
jgi:hypothetical protein